MIANSRLAGSPANAHGHLPPDLYLLADHLDAALALGEDLLAERVERPAAHEAQNLHAIQRHNRELTALLQTVRTYELAMIARVLQARRRAQDLMRADASLKPLVQLFHSGTAVIADAAEAVRETAEPATLETGDGALAYLRQRGMIDADAIGFGTASGIVISEDFLLLGRIRLGTLMTLIATCLDSLDRSFHLYASADDTGLTVARAAPDDTAASGLDHAPDIAVAPVA